MREQSRNCEDSPLPASLADSAFLDFRISDMHRRMQLLDGVYGSSTPWHNRSTTTSATSSAARDKTFDRRAAHLDFAYNQLAPLGSPNLRRLNLAFNDFVTLVNMLHQR